MAAMIVALIICGTGIALAAQEDSESPLETTQLSMAPQNPPGPELEFKRTATSQTFRLPDGSLETRLYASPINYRDAEGDWKPIEEGLGLAPNGALTNGGNRFDVMLPDKLDDGAVRLEIGDAWVSEQLIGPETEPAQLSAKGAASYEATGSGTTFDLTTLGNGLKENIEIPDLSAPSSFQFELQMSVGLTPSISEDGSLEIRDNVDSLIARAPAPVLSDSDPAHPATSSAVHYSLQHRSEQTWDLSVEVEREWLEQPSRSWPVVLDPTLTVPGPTLDCTYEGIEPGTSEWRQCGSFGYQSLLAQYSLQSGVKHRWRSALKFNLGSIPADAYVTSATVGLYSPQAATNATGVQLRRATKPWSDSVNWQIYAKELPPESTQWKPLPWSTPGGDFTSEGSEVLTSERGSQAGWWNFSQGLAPLVQGWVSGSIPNQGLIVKLPQDASCEPSCTTRSVTFNSSAYPDSQQRPYMQVVYYPPASSDSKVSSPTEGTRSARRFKLSAAWAHAGVTGVYFQYKAPPNTTNTPLPSTWTDVPASAVIDNKNQTVKWPLVIEGGGQKTPAAYWDATKLGYPQPTLEMQIRAVLIGSPGADGYTVPMNAVLDRAKGGVRDATAAVGPGSVDLLTGNFSIARTDASIPGFGSALEFTRALASREAPTTFNTGVLGKGWKPGVTVEAAGGADWRSVRLEVAMAEEENEKGEIVTVPVGEYAVLTDLEGYESAFEANGSGFKTPPELTGWVLSRENGELILADPAGNRTAFSNSSGGKEYLPTSVTQTGGADNKTQMVYAIVAGSRRLSMVIAPAAAGVPCTQGNATTQLGCRSLVFAYQPASKWGAPTEYGERLSSITYYGPSNATSMGNWEVAKYEYDSQGRLKEEWDPRISPALKEAYTYTANSQLQTIKPPGQEPWTLEYETLPGEEGSGRLVRAKRPSLLASPSVAQTTIAYGVPVSGSGAPYDLSGSAVAAWGQQDIPTDATAIFPPDEIPPSPPSSYSRATLYYMDSEGLLVNTATPSGAGTSAPSITTTETDEFGNVVRELSAQNRLRALAAGAESATRSHELETKRIFSADGTEMQEEWGPLHQVRLESGEVKQARLHRTVQYDENWPKTGVKPHLPTLETTGASVPGQGTDADQPSPKPNTTGPYVRPPNPSSTPSVSNCRRGSHTTPSAACRPNEACRRNQAGAMPTPPRPSTTAPSRSRPIPHVRASRPGQICPARRCP
jgi:hypothetical protein